MAKNLIIVESPAKAKTIKKYLGREFEVLASYGHVRDLLPKEGAVDPGDDFAMKYQVIDKNSRHVNAIAKALKQAEALYLATDPDREGEAISWHLYELLRQRKLLKNKTIGRVVFHEITKRAIRAAVEQPRALSMDLVNAQQARRALDYLVGFNLSPLLWKKIRRGLSAGRVQSPALRMIVEREEEIERFKAREYWTIEADLNQDGQNFRARLTHFEGNKLGQFDIADSDRAHHVEQALLQAASGQLVVARVEKKQRRRNPAPPFTTSTLQQEASRKLGFSAQRTMRVAQQLYEGIDIGGETTGLITYMRTDSVNLAAEAIEGLRNFIHHRFGSDNVPPQPRLFKTKSKNAQEAHEAIRPTAADLTPESMKTALNRDQLRLYELIWKRTLACQMIHATIDTVGVDLIAGSKDNCFRATGSTIVHPGFMAVYQEGSDDAREKDGESKLLPRMLEGEKVPLTRLVTDQHFTEPPPRFTEASLVKTLEEHGIGRPSTYASIIMTLQNREYVEMDQRRFMPTDVGRVVNRFLTRHFHRYVEYDFTAHLENELDDISRGERDWIPVMRSFWDPFKQLVDEKEQSVSRKEVTQEAIDEACPQCGKPLSIRLGKRGRFIGCTAYPDCNYTRDINGESKSKSEPQVVEGRSCPKCGEALLLREGKYGKFIGCSAYPKCRHIDSLDQPSDTGVTCPQCHTGSIVQRKSRRGKIFYSCSTYPDCSYAIWEPPLDERCPSCNWPILTRKTTKRRGVQKVCPQPECHYAEAMDR